MIITLFYQRRQDGGKSLNHHLVELANTIFSQKYADKELTVPFTSKISVLGGGTPKTSVAEYWNGGIPFFTPKDALDTFSYHTEKYISESGIVNSSAKLYPHFTTFVTARGTVGKLSMAGIDMSMNQSCYTLKFTDGEYPFFTFQLAKQVVENLKRKANGAVFDAIVTRDFSTEMIPNFTSVEIQNIESILESLYPSILANTEENIRLQELRDSILPKLMSGEISVKG